MAESRKDWIVTIALFILVNALSYHYEDAPDINKARQWDCRHYAAMSRDLAKFEPPKTQAPFAYRIGTPLLVALVNPEDPMAGYLVVNLAANLVSILLLLVLFRKYIDNWVVRSILMALFITNWQGPIRLIFYTPVYVDFWPFVLMLILLLLCLKHDKLAYLAAASLVAFIGAFFREIVLVAAFAFAFVQNPVSIDKDFLLYFKYRFKNPPKLYLPLAVAAIVFIALNLAITPADNSYSFQKAALNYFKMKWIEQYLHGWYIAYGPILFVVAYNWRRNLNFLMENQSLMVFLLAFAFLGLIGSHDTERILYFASPAIYILFGKSILDLKPVFGNYLFVAFLAANQAISHRLFWTIPDFPNRFGHKFTYLTPWSSEAPLWDLFSSHAYGYRKGINPSSNYSFLEYNILGIILLLWMRRIYLNIKAAENKNP